MLLGLERGVALLLGQTPALEEKGLQLEIINTVFINRLLHPRSSHIRGNERRRRRQHAPVYELTIE